MNMRYLMVMCLVALGLGACRGQPSAEPPVHLNPNMDSQEKYKAQSKSHFFADKRTMRTPVEGTVARGLLKEDDAYYRGKEGDAFIPKVPVEVNEALLARGHERFDIFCAPCHDVNGGGKGPVIARGFVPPPTIHQDRIRNMPDGQIFSIISNGVRTMPSYRHQVPEPDRWAIVAHVRALQQAQAAPQGNIPADKGSQQ